MLLNDHPLANTIWHTKSGEQVTIADLREEVIQAEHLLVGERHDNPLHHDQQALIVSMVREAGKTGQLVMEMADMSHAQILSQASAANVDTLGALLDWSGRGWPDWSQYQPIVEEALAADMRLKPGNPTRDILMMIGRGGEAPDSALEDLRWDVTYDEAQLDDLLTELVDAHCGMMGRDAMGPLATMQRLKDAHMGRAMRQNQSDGEISILIAGNGHTRKDRGVPMFLEGAGRILSVALIEVVRGETDTKAYSSFDPELYDFVWFTPRFDEVDPCQKFREQLESMKSRMGKQPE